MKMKHWMKLVCFLTFLSVVFLLNYQRVDAEAKKVSLKAEVTYHDYDITGDGEKDSLLVTEGKTSDDDAHEVLEVYINNQRALRLKTYFYYTDIDLVVLQNGKPFLYLKPTSDNDVGLCVIYQYQDGKLVKVVDLNKLTWKIGDHNGGYIKEVKNNKIIVRAYVQSYAVAGISFDCTYKYEDDTLKLTGTTYKICDYCPYDAAKGKERKSAYITANRGFNVYKSISSGKVSSRIKKGDKVKLSKIYLNGKKTRFKIKTKSGKSGWFISPKNYMDEDKKYFVEMQYAG